MKKKYIAPSMEIIEIASEVPLASSVSMISTEDRFGGSCADILDRYEDFEFDLED